MKLMERQPRGDERLINSQSEPQTEARPQPQFQYSFLVDVRGTAADCASSVSRQHQTLDNQAESQQHDDTETAGRQQHRELSQQAVLRGPRRRRKRRRSLWHLAVDARPALVALAGELVLHVQDVVAVEVASDVEAGAPGGRRVAAPDVEEVRVQVQSSVTCDRAYSDDPQRTTPDAPKAALSPMV
ncbi:hypothetical protein EYF80_037667 [Liparis tanakae]|uniref:Uncharacterized protein n=1 Tax=Liparis tanakae TaxID=230148 RepID=A0A4Z2GF04_9TELE|nr:hypothetical protein EYF80_037667 [Liparis tanakae]